MSLKESTLTIQSEGRDRGKVFSLTEWSAIKADRWANRALLAIMKSNPDIPTELAGSGVAGLLNFGVKGLMRTDAADAQQLMDEMLSCAEIVPDTRNPNIKRQLVESDIEEVATLWELRVAIFSLHTDFFSLANSSTSPAPEETTSLESANISTSQKSPAPSSRRVKHRFTS